jgi:GNAT superfamily N-acetyltransferase
MPAPAPVIRSFTPRDQMAVRALILAGLGDHFGFIDETRNPDLDDIAGAYLARGHVFVVGELAGTVVATGALVAEDARIGRLVGMSVAHAHRREGLGRLMVAYLLAAARQRGYSQVVLETNGSWDDARALYRACGFVEETTAGELVHMRLTL